MDEEEILKELSKTDLIKHIKEIRAIYDKLEKKQKRFMERFDLSCMEGCGKCCEGFVPDITGGEAAFLAYGLIAEGREEEILAHLAEYDPDLGACPLYTPNSPYHCTVYRWRPLICRLFGGAASEDKQGHPRYTSCKWNEVHKVLSAEELEAHKRDLVMMADFGQMLDQTEGDPRTMLLYEALPKAIDKIRYMLELEEESLKNHSPK